VFIGVQHGIWVALLGLAGFVSMFRNPLIFLWRMARGEKPEVAGGGQPVGDHPVA